MSHLPEMLRRWWHEKFRDAFRGVGIGVRGQASFLVHALFAVAVIAFAAVTHLNAWQWCAVLLCVAVVLVSEMFNTSLEVMAKAIDTQYNPQLGDVLDIASGAVLLAAVGSVMVGGLVCRQCAALNRKTRSRCVTGRSRRPRGRFLMSPVRISNRNTTTRPDRGYIDGRWQ